MEQGICITKTPDPFAEEVDKILFTSQDNYFKAFQQFRHKEITYNEAIEQMVQYRNEAKSALLTAHQQSIAREIVETRMAEFEEVVDFFKHSNLTAFEDFIKAHRHNLKSALQSHTTEKESKDNG